MAKLRQEDLAILLLDFEKAYDRMDWDLLEGTLNQFGFEDSWIRGVAGLYWCATSQVLLARGWGPSFNLSRSIRQGCPLALFLFLFFAETMSVYLTTKEFGLRGLQMPI